MAKGKLRNGSSDLEKLAQWVGRKMRNHNPLGKIDTAEPRLGRDISVGVIADDRSTVIFTMRNGRRFQIALREMEPEEEVPQLVDVGY